MQSKNSNNPIDADIVASAEKIGPSGLVASIARKYGDDSPRLLGFSLTLNFNEMRIVTCDPWKRLCGGVPRNSFVIVKLSAKQVDPEDRHFCDRLILARVTDSVPTPVESDLQSTIYQIHKVRAFLDPVTQKELQWSALKASIVGTYYDANEKEISFGNDVDTFFAPHAYEVYVPTADDLGVLINSFVKSERPLEIGRLRYTETPSAAKEQRVAIQVDPRDFVGRDYGHRTALFGKTRFGKSNTIKVIADTILNSNIKVGQIIFDPSGEYTYWNEQDRGSLFALHSDKCVRYSLNPREIPEEKKLGFEKPKTLKINFFDAVSVGHGLIVQLWDSEHSNRPGYMQPILNWTPPDLSDEPSERQDKSGYNHFWRTMSMWYAVLRLTGFQTSDRKVFVDFRDNVKTELISRLGDAIEKTREGDFAKFQRIDALPAIYREVAQLSEEHGSHRDWFPNSSNDGSPYFNEVEKSFLQILKNDGSVSGSRYFNPFLKYHDPSGSNTFEEISNHAKTGKTVLIDFAKADEHVRTNLSERICRKVLGDMMTRFSHNALGDDFIVLYFEEAHTLFRQDDKDLNGIYNKIAKEGAKFHLSMVYATQSMTTMSPDLLKNTENFIIAHLDDDREVREVTRKYTFRDVADDIQMTQSKGFVRMITLSHRFALPVQITKFRAASSEEQK